MGSEPDRFRMTYTLTCPAGQDPVEMAQALGLEQTVELPGECLPAGVEEMVGRVESLEVVEGDQWRAVLSYPMAVVGRDLLQYLNLLFGNISLLRGIRLTDFTFPASWLDQFPGPRFGIDGLRRLCGVGARRALSASAVKPLGLDADQLAARSHALARGGVDIVKDDHALVDQPMAPFGERVPKCQAAVTKANAETGGSTIYVPNLTGRTDQLEGRLDLVAELGCRAVLVSPLLMGWDLVRFLADRGDVALIAHPSLCGAFFHDDHGIAPDLLLGVLFRLIGSDAVIFPNAGGRFPFTEPTCQAIAERLRGPLGRLQPSAPMPGGGIDLGQLTGWIDRYGPDTVFLIGSSLYRAADLETAARRFRDTLAGAG